MKRQKRDPSHRVLLRGYLCGFNNKLKSSCAHSSESPNSIDS